MPDHITTEAARASWAWTERTIRLASTRARLDALDKLSALLPVNDRVDAASEIFRDYIDGRRAVDLLAPVDQHELNAQATILHRASKYLSQSATVAFAREAWGGRSFAAHIDDATHLAWYPGDDAIVVTLTSGGVTGTLVLTVDRVPDRVL